MSITVGAGLAALQQADSDLAAAVTQNTADTQAVLANIQELNAQLANNEDPAVQTIAADLETKIAALQASNTALAAVVAPPAAPTPAA
jgi:phage shock protein A